MKKFLITILLLTFLVMGVVSATEVTLTMPKNKEVFTTNDFVSVRFYLTGSYPIVCVFEQKSSNRYFETEPDTYAFWPGWHNMLMTNSLEDWHLYNGIYKLQIICTDANGDVGESELVKFHVKGNIKWPE